MKKQLLCAGMVATAMLFSFSTFAQDAPEANVYEIHDAITIDGVADEAVWPETGFALDPERFGNNETTENTGSWKAVWDATNLYVFIDVQDAAIVLEETYSGSHWNFDKVEVYLDVNVGNLADALGPSTLESGHYQFAPNASQEMADAALAYEGTDRGNTNICSAIGVVETAEGYAVEMSIPWAALATGEAEAVVPADGEVYGFDVVSCDNDAGTSRTGRIPWSYFDNWSNMDNAGLITLVETSAINSVVNDNQAVYPTYANSTLTVTVDASSAVIINSVGQVVRKVSVTGNEISVAGLPAGVYFINLNTKDGIVSSKFLKN